MCAFDAVRTAAILDLQRRRDRFLPGSFDERVYDLAIDLAMSERREAASVPFLVYDTIRNAKHGIARSADRESAANARHSRVVLRLIPTDPEGDTPAAVNVEDEAIASLSEFCACALRVSAGLGDFGPTFVHLLMDGWSVTDAGAAIGLSRSAAYRAKAQLADLLAAQRHLTQEAA